MSRRFWRKLLPYPLGTRVRVTRETIRKRDENLSLSYVGKIGTIIEYCGMEDKKYLVERNAFPPTILREIMYIVKLDKDSVELIFRDNELEAVTDGK